MISDKQLLEIAGKFGTPLFVYDADLMAEKCRDLHKFIPNPNLRIHYAMKANYNIALLRRLLDEGIGLDTVSPGEVKLALKLGFPKERIIYTANNMTDAEADAVAATGVIMNIGSLSRLRKFGRKYPGREICLRFNPDVCDGDSAKTMTGGDLTKFGLLFDDLDEVLDIVRSCKLKVAGLHEHTGSGLQKCESVYRSMENLMKIATPENFPDLRFMDFGGGFKVPYREDEERIDYVAMGKEIDRMFREFCAGYGRELEIYFEPGKFIAAECGTFLLTVNTIKHNRTRTIAGCDGGFPQLIRPVLYDAYHIINNLSNPSGERKLYDVCGNICETGDRFAEQRSLPEIREGDVLAIRNAGAYCYSMGGVYNLRSMPGEAVVSGGEVKLVRRRLSDDELTDSIIKESSF